MPSKIMRHAWHPEPILPMGLHCSAFCVIESQNKYGIATSPKRKSVQYVLIVEAKV